MGSAAAVPVWRLRRGGSRATSAVTAPGQRLPRLPGGHGSGCAGRLLRWVWRSRLGLGCGGSCAGFGGHGSGSGAAAPALVWRSRLRLRLGGSGTASALARQPRPARGHSLGSAATAVAPLGGHSHDAGSGRRLRHGVGAGASARGLAAMSWTAVGCSSWWALWWVGLECAAGRLVAARSLCSCSPAPCLPARRGWC